MSTLTRTAEAQKYKLERSIDSSCQVRAAKSVLPNFGTFGAVLETQRVERRCAMVQEHRGMKEKEERGSEHVPDAIDESEAFQFSESSAYPSTTMLYSPRLSFLYSCFRLSLVPAVWIIFQILSSPFRAAQGTRTFM